MDLEYVKETFVECPSVQLDRKKHSLLYNFLVMNPISEETITACCQLTPQFLDFNFWIGYLSSLQNLSLEIVSFSRWLMYVRHVVEVCARVCSYALTDTEKELYPYAVAVRVYPDAKRHLTGLEILSDKKIEELLSFVPEKDEQKWALYIVGDTVLEALLSEKTLRAGLFIRLMEKLNPITEGFPALEDKFNNYRVGKGIA